MASRFPIELEKLFQFDSTIAKDNYFSTGFELGDSKKGMLRTYSEDKRFLQSIIEFAQASHSASLAGNFGINAAADPQRSLLLHRKSMAQLSITG
jgi:hypothetical protein